MLEVENPPRESPRFRSRGYLKSGMWVMGRRRPAKLQQSCLPRDRMPLSLESSPHELLRRFAFPHVYRRMCEWPLRRGRCRYSYGHGSAKISLVRLSEALGWAPTAVVRELRRCAFSVGARVRRLVAFALPSRRNMSFFGGSNEAIGAR